MNAGESQTTSRVLEQPTNEQTSDEHHKPDSGSQAFVSKQPAPTDISKSVDDDLAQPQLKDFPKTQIGDRKRSFSSHWYSKFPFIEYSTQRDAVFCFPCRHFPLTHGNSDGVFTNLGFQNWKKIGSKLDGHKNSETHKDSMARWQAFTQVKMTGTVVEQLDRERSAVVASNRQFLTSIAKVAVLCARQCIALRGHNESDSSENKGNFLEILQLVAAESDDLRSRMESSPANAKYISKDTQNDLLKAAAAVVLDQITSQIKEAKYFAVMADESRDVSRIEQLSLCVRYVEPKTFTVQERFIGFSSLHSLDAESVAREIVSQLEQLGLNVGNCIAQCYDGAAVMSGHVSGVQTRITQALGGKCVYIHCYAHRLNLVLVNTAHDIKEVSDFFGLMEATHRFFSVSALRHDKLVQVQLKNKVPVLEIPRLSDTRWVCRYAAVNLFQSRYDCLVEVFDQIVENSSDRVEAAEAMGLLTQIQKCKFVVLLSIFQDILGVTKPLSDMLQAKDLDLASAMELVDAVIEVLNSRRNEAYFKDVVWQKVLEMAEHSGIEVTQPETRRSTRVPRRLDDAVVTCNIVGRQSSENPENAYRIIYYQVMDKFLGEISARFHESRELMLGVAACNPQSPVFLDASTISPLASKYDLDVTALSYQLAVAKAMLTQRGVTQMTDVLQVVSHMKDAFPLLTVLYRIVLTIPVTSASPERSFSALKHVKTYLRTTMGQDRLKQIAILAIERNLSGSLDYCKVLDKFKENGPRRIQLWTFFFITNFTPIIFLCNKNKINDIRDGASKLIDHAYHE